MLPTIEWQDDVVVMIDQRKLPSKEIYVRCRTSNEVAKAIKTMVIRGAPAIGVAAAMGLALGVEEEPGERHRQLTADFFKNCEVLAGTRPTAVNLFWAIDRMKRRVRRSGAGRRVGRRESRAAARPRRMRIHDEDVASCRALGVHGAALVPEKATHPDALQRRRARDRRLRHGARRDSRRRRDAARRCRCSPTRRARSCRARA